MLDGIRAGNPKDFPDHATLIKLVKSKQEPFQNVSGFCVARIRAMNEEADALYASKDKDGLDAMRWPSADEMWKAIAVSKADGEKERRAGQVTE